MSKKPVAASPAEEHHGADLEAELAKMTDFQNSIGVVSQILEETILTKGAEHLYNMYLKPKVLPYAAYHTIALTKTQVSVSQRASVHPSDRLMVSF